MLPFASPTDGIDCRRNIEESNVNCFTAGNEHNFVKEFIEVNVV